MSNLDSKVVNQHSIESLLARQQRTIVDLSIAIENHVASDPEPYLPQITYLKHRETYQQLLPFFPGLDANQLRDQEAWAVEELEINTHNGTHMDAPYHYHSTMEGGQRSWTIDEVPLDWCFRSGVKLDFRHIADGDLVSADDVEAELERISYTLKPLDIVLINTRAGSRYGEDDYIHSGCGMGREATLYLTSRGVRVVGTDAWSWDAPFLHTARRFAKSQDPSIIWEGHKAGADIGYFQMEKLHNLESLPGHGFEVVCFPVKIKGASAGFTRTVAIVG